MKIKIMLLMSIATCLVSFLGCSNSVNNSVQIKESDGTTATYNSVKFIKLSNVLVYDNQTKIVYLEEYTYNSNEIHTPYIASNGLPYRYNPDTQTLEEIDIG